MGVDHGRSQTARRAARRPDIAAAPRSHIARIRHGVSWEAEAATLRPNPNTTHAGMLADKKFREGIAVVGRLGLSYDVSLYHTQIGEVADLAGALPNTRIVVNHVGGVLGLGSYQASKRKCFRVGRHRSFQAAFWRSGPRPAVPRIVASVSVKTVWQELSASYVVD